jgi:Asp/Glu/hydantoin racemase
MRIAFVHTMPSLLERFKSDMADQHPHIDCFHILNEGLLQDLTRGEERQSVYRRAVAQMLIAVDNYADLVVMTCTSLSPAVDIARNLCVTPILKLDDPMSAEAVRLGHRIAVLCTNTCTPGPSAGLLRQHAAAQGREILVETVVRPEAYTALFAGDRKRHDSIIVEAAREAAARADVLVLSQITLCHLEDTFAAWGKPVLTSPPYLMADLTRRLAPLKASV